MHKDAVQLIDLAHGSPEFDQAYAILSSDIAPEFMETAEFLRNRLRVRDEGPKTEAEKIALPQDYTLHLIADIGPDNQGIGLITYVAVHQEHRKQGIVTMLLKALKTRVNGDALTLCNKPACSSYPDNKKGAGMKPCSLR